MAMAKEDAASGREGADRAEALASLPMYDRASVRSSTDALYAGLVRAARLRGFARLPSTLCRSEDPRAVWRAPTLVFTQACGLDVAHGHRGELVPIAAADYRASGAAGPRYTSVVVARAGRFASLADARSSRAAINEPGSHSGFTALYESLAEAGVDLRAEPSFFASVALTGGHAASVAAVDDGAVDLACIDSITWHLLVDEDPGLAQRCVVLHRSPPAPVPPFSVPRRLPAAEREALRAATLSLVDDPALRGPFARLGITGIEPVDPSHYDELRDRYLGLALDDAGAAHHDGATGDAMGTTR